MAAGLLAPGTQPEDRVAIASATRIEWLYADLAIMCAGAATGHPTAVDEAVAAVGPEHLATLIYTSGTTGASGRTLGPDRDAHRGPDGIRIVLVEVPAGHPLRRDP